MSVVEDIEVRAEKARRDLRRLAQLNPDLRRSVEEQIAMIDEAVRLASAILTEIEAEIEEAG